MSGLSSRLLAHLKILLKSDITATSINIATIRNLTFCIASRKLEFTALYDFVSVLGPLPDCQLAIWVQFALAEFKNDNHLLPSLTQSLQLAFSNQTYHSAAGALRTYLVHRKTPELLFEWIIRLLDITTLFGSSGDLDSCQCAWHYGVLCVLSVWLYDSHEAESALFEWSLDQITLLRDWIVVQWSEKLKDLDPSISEKVCHFEIKLTFHLD